MQYGCTHGLRVLGVGAAQEYLQPAGPAGSLALLQAVPVGWWEGASWQQTPWKRVMSGPLPVWGLLWAKQGTDRQPSWHPQGASGQPLCSLGAQRLRLRALGDGSVTASLSSWGWASGGPRWDSVVPGHSAASRRDSKKCPCSSSQSRWPREGQGLQGPEGRRQHLGQEQPCILSMWAPSRAW